MAAISDIPRGRATQRLASFAVYGAAPVALAVVWWLRTRGLFAPTPIWIMGVILAGGAIANYGTTLWLQRDPDSVIRINARVAASVLATALTIYAVGWGSILLIAYAVGSAELVRIGGPRTTIANLTWSLAAISLGEIAIELGWAPSVVRPELAHAIAITGAVCVAIVTRVLGQSVKAAEDAEDRVRERAQHYESLIRHASDLIGVVSRDGVVLSVSPAVTSMLGYDPDDVAGRPVTMFLEEREALGVGALLKSTGTTVGAPTSFELPLRHADGSIRWAIATLTQPTAESSDELVLNVHDVTTQRELERRLRHDARHDALTGLLNRKAFGESSERSCAHAAQLGRTVGMLYIDLDGFKRINDTFGHDAGDVVLVESAARLRSCMTNGETLARLGGDEFAVLVDCGDNDHVVALAERILETLGRPISGLPNDVRVGASIGIALRSSDGIEISTLIRDADAAMYEAKRKGRARWELDAAGGIVVEI